MVERLPKKIDIGAVFNMQPKLHHNPVYDQ